MSDLPPPTETPITPIPDPLLPPKLPDDKSWAAVTSLCCGGGSLLGFCFNFVPLVGSCCCFVTPLASIAAVVFGIIGLKSQKSMFAKAGIGLGILSIVLYVVLFILAIVFHVVVGNTRTHF